MPYAYKKKKEKRTGGHLVIAIIGACIATSCGDTEKNSDVKSQVGTTCYSYPVIRHATTGLNVCAQPGEKFYGGLLALAARSAIVKECQNLNGLDYGYLGGGDQSCYDLCSKSPYTYCLDGTNN